MRGAYLDRARAGRLMAEAGLDALVFTQPENIQYATGAAPGVAALFRRAGAAIALVPAAEGLLPGAVMPDLSAGAVAAGSDVADVRFLPIWVGTAKLRDGAVSNPDATLSERLEHGLPPGRERPSTFDARAGFGHLRDMLAERGLLGARLGIEFDYLPVSDFALLREVIPEARFSDASALVRRLRMVKTPREIALLRAGCRLAEEGVGVMLGHARAGVSRDRLGESFCEAVRAAARAGGVGPLTGVWEYVSVGRSPWGAPAALAAGDVVKVDVGAVLAGYSSDSARTFVFGTASADQRAVHAALAAGFEAGFAALGPGVKLAAIHAAMLGAIRRSGLPGYARGHFGHGLGQSVFSEEWPFIAADSDVTAEPGMVLALEAPFYVEGLGGFIVEDQVLITEAGAETMNALPRELIELPLA